MPMTSPFQYLQNDPLLRLMGQDPLLRQIRQLPPIQGVEQMLMGGGPSAGPTGMNPFGLFGGTPQGQAGFNPLAMFGGTPTSSVMGFGGASPGAPLPFPK